VEPATPLSSTLLFIVVFGPAPRNQCYTKATPATLLPAVSLCTCSKQGAGGWASACRLPPRSQPCKTLHPYLSSPRRRQCSTWLSGDCRGTGWLSARYAGAFGYAVPTMRLVSSLQAPCHQRATGGAWSHGRRDVGGCHVVVLCIPMPCIMSHLFLHTYGAPSLDSCSSNGNMGVVAQCGGRSS
jgi:hypothetical protein